MVNAIREKGRAEAMNDVTVFAIGLSGTFSAGAVIQRFEWETMNAALMPQQAGRLCSR
jgi:hypothetical protein